MANIVIDLPAVDGSLYDYLGYDHDCKDVIHNLWSDDFGAPPRHMRIKVKTNSGKHVQIIIPYSNDQNAFVTIDGDTI